MPNQQQPNGTPGKNPPAVGHFLSPQRAMINRLPIVQFVA
jgi:hypothetical protein